MKPVTVVTGRYAQKKMLQGGTDALINSSYATIDYNIKNSTRKKLSTTPSTSNLETTFNETLGVFSLAVAGFFK